MWFVQIRVRCQFGLSNCKSSWCRWGSTQFNCPGNSDTWRIVLRTTSALSRCKEIETWRAFQCEAQDSPFSLCLNIFRRDFQFVSCTARRRMFHFTREEVFLVGSTHFFCGHAKRSPKGRLLVTSSSVPGEIEQECVHIWETSQGWKSQRVRVRLRDTLDLHLFSWCFNGNEKVERCNTLRAGCHVKPIPRRMPMFQHKDFPAKTIYGGCLHSKHLTPDPDSDLSFQQCILYSMLSHDLLAPAVGNAESLKALRVSMEEQLFQQSTLAQLIPRCQRIPPKYANLTFYDWRG